MCGRFARRSPIPVIAERFNIEKIYVPEVFPNYNIAPNQEVLIVNHTESRQLLSCRWGFLPSWVKDASKGITNARAETVAEKSTFRYALKKHRCLVVADGFFEWKTKNGRKYPVYIKLKSGEPFGFAGMSNLWESPDGSVIFTCAIITTEANKLIKPIHPRMPAVILIDKEDLWLAPDTEDKDALLSLLKPYPPEDMELYPVSPKMNSPAYNSPENIQPMSSDMINIRSDNTFNSGVKIT